MMIGIGGTNFSHR